jgi:hypothetical protein
MSKPLHRTRSVLAKRNLKTKLNIQEFTKIQIVIGAYLGLLAGILYSFGGFIIDTLVTLELVTTNETPGLSYGTVLAFGALFGMPAIGALIGLISGIVGAILYNYFSNWFGGMSLDIKK